MSSGTHPIDEARAGPDPSLTEGSIVQRTLQDGGLEYLVHLPVGAAADAPLFVAIHHNSRDAEEQATVFRTASQRHGAVLVAPRFPTDRFPDYQRLGRDRRGGKQGKRADAVLQDVVDEVTALLGGVQRPVYLFGYAAGGRFAQRHAMAHPDRVAGLVIASAGTYTLPDPELRFPLGIGVRPGWTDLRFDVDAFLRLPITVFESREELRPAPSARPNGGSAPRPGPERTGRVFCAAMQAAAAQRGLPSAVKYREVGGTSVSFRDYAERRALAREVFEALFGPAVAPAGDSAPPAEAPTEPLERALAFVREQARRYSLSRRRVVAIAAAVALLALLLPLLVWVHYRATHIISREAMVRGPIADVGARVDGVLESVLVDTGKRVVAGQVIARLQSKHFEARVRQVRSQLEKASRELEVERLAIANERQQRESSLTEVSARSAAAAADVAAVESLAMEARRRLELQKSLAAQGLLAEEAVRVAETQHRTALARLEASIQERKAAAAAQQLASVESDGIAVREKHVSVLESEIASYQAELAVAEANLEGSVIRAPGDGAVVRRIVEPGGAIVVGKPALSLWIGGSLWVEAWVDEDQLADLAVGSEAVVTINSFPGREFKGVVESLLASTDYELPDSEVPQPRHERMRNTPVVGVRIRLEETDAELFPGLSAVVGIRKRDS